MNANYNGEMRTKAGQGAILPGEGVESRTVVDFSGAYSGFGKFTLFANIRNLTDETYIIARRPYGVRPGLERSVLVGIKAGF